MREHKRAGKRKRAKEERDRALERKWEREKRNKSRKI